MRPPAPATSGDRTRSRLARASASLAGTLPAHGRGLSRTWWSRPGLEVRDRRLAVAGRDAEDVARTSGTPAYVYDLTRIEEQASALRNALADAGLRGLIRLALKAQREPDVLAFLRERCPWVGLTSARPARSCGG